MPYTDFIDWDVWVGRVTYRYGVRAEIKGQGSSVTIFPDRIKLWPLTMQEDGKVTRWVTPFTYPQGPVSHRGQIGVSVHSLNFSSLKVSVSVRAKTAMEGEELSVSSAEKAELELEIRPKQLAVVPVVVVVGGTLYLASQGTIQLQQLVPAGLIGQQTTFRRIAL